MKIVDRYIGATVIAGSLTALLVLVGIAAFFGFIGQLDDLSAHYGILRVLGYVGLSLPQQAYELFPTAVLLGTLLSLGNLAANSELIVMRAAGLSLGRIAWAVLRAGLFLMLIAAALGELLAPSAERQAQALQAAGKSGYVVLNTAHGFWARDGSNFVNIGRVLPSSRLEDIYIYGYGKDLRLERVTHARWAEYDQGRWVLHGIRRSRISAAGVTTRVVPTEEWNSVISPDLLSVLSVKPEDLSAWSLASYIGYLNSNNLDSRRYQLAFWIKVVTPLSTLVMLLIALPFVFGPLRSTTTGVRLLIGVLVGVGFYLLNQVLNHLGVVYGINPVLSAALPSALFAASALWAMRRIR